MKMKDKEILLKMLCYIVAIPLAVLAARLFIIIAPFIGIIFLTIVIGTVLVYYFDLYDTHI